MIQLKNVSLKVPTSSHNPRGLVSSLKSMYSATPAPQITKSQWIVSNISFELEVKDRVGIFGRNGAGKSSLLRLIAGMYKPTTGKIDIEGDVLPLLELGAGFQPEFTGRENIYLNGAILGYRRDEIFVLENEIIRFSGLEESIDIPIKYYSSGMSARLAFSMVTSLMPDILILDEVFAAGDKFFHKQALEKINSLIDKSNIVIMVSHNMSFLKQTCNRFLWIEGGRLIKQGGMELLDEYEALRT